MAPAQRSSSTSKAAAADTAADNSTTSKADADELRTTSAPAETEAPMSASDAPAAEAKLDDAPTAAPVATLTDASPDVEAAPEDPTNGGRRVPITLAHPIDNEEHMRRLRLDVKPGGYNVHDVIYLVPDDARALITAGLAQVDPEDAQAVHAALTGSTQDA